MVEEELDGLKVESVPGPPGYESSGDLTSEEVEVTDQVQDFMADELVREAEGTVDDFFGVQNESVGEGPAQGQPLPPKLGYVLEEAERPGRRDSDTECPFRHLKVDLLLADGGMIEINEIADLESGGRQNLQGGFAGFDDENA